MSENIILSTATVIEALNKLEFIENKVYTLFVLDKRTLQLIGTLTDGDIRRYLINGITQIPSSRNLCKLLSVFLSVPRIYLKLVFIASHILPFTEPPFIR